MRTVPLESSELVVSPSSGLSRVTGMIESRATSSDVLLVLSDPLSGGRPIVLYRILGVLAGRDTVARTRAWREQRRGAWRRLSIFNAMRPRGMSSNGPSNASHEGVRQPLYEQE
jgi:hypothetical protein